MHLRLLRHAKSDWGNAAQGDRERGLNNRGRRAAPSMGRALAQRLPPQTIHVSPARRAQLTLAGLCEGWPEMAAVPHLTVENLYSFSYPDLVDWIVEQPGAQDLFLVGHNPAFTDLINWCCADNVISHLPTAGYAELVVNIKQWSALEPGCGELVYSLFPRELQEPR